MDQRIREANQRATGVTEKNSKPLKNILKFHYGFSTKWENIIRVAKTRNLVFGLLFCEWFEDPALQFNGTEWTSFYFRNVIQNEQIASLDDKLVRLI